MSSNNELITRYQLGRNNTNIKSMVYNHLLTLTEIVQNSLTDINNVVIDEEPVDFNDLITKASYDIAILGNTNSPVNELGNLKVYKTDSQITQIYYTHDDMFIRNGSYENNSYTWADWSSVIKSVKVSEMTGNDIDFNLLVSQNFYHINSTSNKTNSPCQYGGELEVHNSSLFIVQKFYSSDGNFYVRNYNLLNNSWSEWKSVGSDSFHFESNKNGLNILDDLGKNLFTLYVMKSSEGVEATQLSVIKNLMQSMASLSHTDNLEGVQMIDYGISHSNNHFQTTQSLIDSFLSDLNTSLSNGQSTKDFLEEYCDIILDNDDTGAIIGFDAGGNSIYNAENILAESNDSAVDYPVNTATISDYVARYKTIKNTNYLFPSTDGLDDNWRYALSLIASCHIYLAMDLIEKSYGLSFNSSTSGLKSFLFKNSDGETINIYSYPYIPVMMGNDSKSLATLGTGVGAMCSWTWINCDESVKASTINIYINDTYYSPLVPGNLNGKSVNYHGSVPYLDRCLVHEIVHGVMAANIPNFSSSSFSGTYIDSTSSEAKSFTVTNGLPLWFTEGSAELIHGIDDARRTNILAVCSSVERMTTALGNGTYTSNEDPYSAGYILLRYYAKQASERG